MPAIVIGGDTESGRAILEGLNEPNREVRAFVTSESIGAELKSQGIKVAIGDVSDESHVEAAAMRCFSAILIVEAAADDRERSFLDSADEVTASWARAISMAGVTRAIWVNDGDPVDTETREVAAVRADNPDLVDEVVRLDDAQTIS